ncbi:hydantoinase/oxoprolinase family protein [Xanthobacter sp. V4C-4]|uniref:hydantoinase/oxoprolinase family protein n=1 Tax=Xanthobacter cornucopiae TaxID=3119924 RepID=UPI00372A4531
MTTSHLLLGWDVGGAHLKRAVLDATGRLVAVDLAPCALWQGLDRLDAAIASLPPAPAAPCVVTMTGELTDLWPDRATGVVGLAAALAQRLGPETRFYAGPDGFVPQAAARAHADTIASANWHATAAALALRQPAGVLVDIGSTTSDLLYFAGQQIKCRGYTDAERMVSGELLYCGAARTPVMALGPTLPFRGAHVPLMMEYFATTADVHRLTGELPDHADLHPTADGGAKTREASARRLLRMVGRDLGPCALAEAEALAAYAAELQLQRLHGALALVLSAHGVPPAVPLVGAGVGRFLAAALAARAGRPYLDAGRLLAGNDTLAAGAADCAPAVAVAILAHGRHGAP